ncbi:MAG: asparagine synthase (glutamine-hydrolyzing) [Elusimicrobia bacterium]|nr:asparagine synthase (glutamine-hydrolyzing) [Candidatus Liberimonas magnetica]
MCGIAGIYNLNDKPVRETVLRSMTDILEHRGPDDSGTYINYNIGLGMRRLSIIDLKTGHQPIHNEDNSLWIVFNGEIYNYLDLHKDLEKKHNFSTKSDTEVILHLYEDFGPDCLKYLRGMFAFAIWDDKKKELFIARDRIGKKPLYYSTIAGSFCFASEMKSFLMIPEFKKDINYKAIHYYLNYQYIPGPMTIWNNVYRLDPASYMVVNSEGKKAVEKYWQVDLREKTKLSFDESKEKLKEILTESVKMRMISDVPLGVFLSGGHDSSIIVGLMSRLSNKQVKTFTIGFEEKDFSEAEYARIVAKHFNTEHHEFIVKPDYLDILHKIVWHYDQPYADPSALPSYYVAKLTRQRVKVALNGDGGDENFAGYLRYKALKVSQYISPLFKILPKDMVDLVLSKIPPNESIDAKGLNRYIHRFIKPLREPAKTRNVVWHSYFTNEQKDYIYSDWMKSINSENSYLYLENRFEEAGTKDIIDSSLYADLNEYLPENLLIKMDIASMANSLEARSPFLDHKCIEFAATLPSSWKLRCFNSKYILKETFKDFLPEVILKRGKQGFGTPLGKWFRNELKDYLLQTILSEKAIKRGYFNETNLRKFVKEHIEGRADYGYCLWALLMLELWHIVFIDYPGTKPS